MLVGTVFEKDDGFSALQMCANHLADEVRNIGLHNTNSGKACWEQSFSERSDAISLLQGEGFQGLVGIDYVFRWWGTEDSEELAGEIVVVWKIARDGEIEYYRTWIRLAQRDFLLSMFATETRKREENRKDFQSAFEQWKRHFPG